MSIMDDYTDALDALFDDEAAIWDGLSDEDKADGWNGIPPDPNPAWIPPKNTKILAEHGTSKISIGPSLGDQPSSMSSGINVRPVSHEYRISMGMGGKSPVEFDKVSGKKIAFTGPKNTGPGRNMATFVISTNDNPDFSHYGYTAEEDEEKEYVRSTITGKADAIALFTGGGPIKLATGTEIYNSRGYKNSSIVQDIILNPGSQPESKLQPAILGDRMVDCVEDIYDSIDAVYAILQEFMQNHMEFASKLVTHTGYISPYQSDKKDIKKTIPPADLKHSVRAYVIGIASRVCMSFDAQRMGLSMKKKHFAAPLGKGRITSSGVKLT
jgi:hypothetical protein